MSAVRNIIGAAWLAGLIDGDGSITVHIIIRRGGKITLRPLVIIADYSADCKNIRVVKKLLDDWRITYRVDDGGHRLTVNGWTEALALLERLAPFLVGKKDQAELLIRLCKLRLKRLSRGFRMWLRYYTPEEIEIAVKIRRMSLRRTARSREIDELALKIAEELRSHAREDVGYGEETYHEEGEAQDSRQGPD